MTGQATQTTLEAKTIAVLRGISVEDVLASARPENWFYSHDSKQFIVNIPEWNVNVTHPTVKSFTAEKEDVIFNLPSFSTVYELEWNAGYHSGLLLASNLEKIISEHLDITSDLHFVIPGNVSAPILLGNRTAVDRLTGTISTKFFRASITEYLEGRDK